VVIAYSASSGLMLWRRQDCQLLRANQQDFTIKIASKTCRGLHATLPKGIGKWNLLASFTTPASAGKRNLL
jgi:hypothetical protein